MKPLGAAILRLLLGLTALSSAGWAISLLSHSDQSTPLNAIANRIMSGDSFQQKPLAASSKFLAETNNRTFCNPLEARAIAIIRLRQFEDAIANSDTRLADQQLKTLRSSIDLALSCVPTEGFLWFARYWSAINQGNPASDHFQELRMSYELSPYEGWIALRRSPYVLAIFDALPPDIKEMARNEFSAIVASGFIPDAVKLIKGPAWAFRDDLLSGLSNVRLDLRINLEKKLRAEGLMLQVPGVETPEFRPWQVN